MIFDFLHNEFLSYFISLHLKSKAILSTKIDHLW